MGEEIVKSVKSLVGVYESASKNADKTENRINHDVHSDIEMLKQSPIVAKYRHRLQNELDELVKMRVQLETGEREVNRDHSEDRDERPSVGDGRSATSDEAFQVPCFRSKVLHSSSTISGYRRRPQIPARATFLRNVGIVCATKTVDNEASESKKNQAKLQKVLQEIVSTERVYVKRLSVLDISFRGALSKFNREEYIFQWDSWNQMFSNLPNIRKFHEENLLPLMEQCLQSHTNDSLPKTYIGKVFSDLAPYLKMYSEYAQNYKRCLDILNTAASESPKLQKLILDFEAQDICEGLKVRYFYIEPIQRLPRYELLLREYTSCLSDDSEDLVNGHIALKMVKQANIHSNDTIKNEENFFKIAEIEDCLRDSVDLVSSPRKFIREGNVDVVLPIRGRIESRKLFLFSDLLLICQYYPHPFRPPYCVTDKLDVNLFQVKEVRDRIFLFGPQAIVELLPRSPEDRLAWKKDLESVAKNNEPERLNLVGPGSPLVDHKKQPSLKKTVSIKTRPLGVVAPIMMKEQEVQACMECTEEFGILNRKRSCFACGRVVCRQCAEYKEPLAYLSFEIKRVCNKCHELLQASPNIPTMF